MPPRASWALRAARRQDGLDLWKWRNDKETRNNSFSKRHISWREHRLWFDCSLKRRDRKIYVATQKGKKIGMVRFDFPENKVAEVSINIHPDFRGEGMGRALLSKASQLMTKRYPSRTQKALIRNNNRASEKIFAAAGFFRIQESKKVGYSVWIKKKKSSSSKEK